MILIGIYHDPEEGILVTRKDDGSIELPGSIIWRYAHHAQTFNQINREGRKITRVVFGKCGLSLTLDDVMGFYNITDDISGKSIFCKVLILKPASSPIDRTWRRTEGYEGEFIPADIDKILDLYPNLSVSNKHILVDYFREYLPYISKDPGISAPRLVKSI